MSGITKGDRVGYTVMYGTKPDTRYVTEFGRVTRILPGRTSAEDKVTIAAENPRPHRAKYVERYIRDIELAPLPEDGKLPPICGISLARNTHDEPDLKQEKTIMTQLTAAEQRDKQYRELAATIADQAQAIADGTLKGPRYGHVRLILNNAQTLMAWTPDDRSGMPAAEQEKQS